MSRKIYKQFFSSGESNCIICIAHSALKNGRKSAMTSKINEYKFFFYSSSQKYIALFPISEPCSILQGLQRVIKRVYWTINNNFKKLQHNDCDINNINIYNKCNNN